MKFLDRFKRKPRTEPPPPDYLKSIKGSKGGKSPADPKAESSAPGEKPRPGKDQSVPAIRPAESDLKLELGDFLHRIPAHLLLPGPHDLKTELFFDTSDLAKKIASGQTTLPLAEIYQRVPTIFRGQILENDNIEIRFPWQKLARLVAMTTAGPGGSGDSALAGKLRSKMPTSPSADPVQKPASTRTPKPQPEPAPAKPDSADISSVPPPPASLKLQMPASQPTPLRKEEPLVSPTLAEDLKKSDLPEETQRRIAQIRGEFERQLAEAQTARRALIESRDQLNEEALRLKKEIDRLSYDLANEKAGASAAQELLQRQKAQRQELEEKIAKLSAAVEQSAGKVETTPDIASPRIAELEAETESLRAQVATLSTQLDEVKSRPTPSSTGAQRQVDELQRRITGLEAAQKEAALELQREKEAKGKAEKLLANADRVLRESALHMEATKQDIRKEMEIGFRKQLREMEEQLRNAESQLSEARAKASQPDAHQPSDDQLAHVAPMIAQFEADIENYRDRIKIVIRERDEARQAAARLTEQTDLQPLTEELARSAERVRELEKQLAEAQSIRDQQTSLQEELNRVRSEYAEHTQRTDAARSELESLLTGIREEKSRLANENISNAEVAQREAAKLQQALSDTSIQLQAAVAERDEFKSLTDRLRTEVEQLRTTAEAAGESERNASHLAEALRRLDESSSELADRERKLAAASSDLQALQHTIADLEQFREKAQESAQTASSLEAERTALSARLAELESGLTQTTLGRDSLNEQFGRLSAERDMLAAERDQLTNDLANLRRQTQEENSAREADRAQLVLARDESVANLSESTRIQASLQEELRVVRDGLDASKKAAEQEKHELKSAFLRELEQLKTELTSTVEHRDQAIAKLGATEQQMMQRENEFASRIAALDQAHSAELQAAKHSHAQQLEAAAQERDALQERFQAKLTEAHQMRATSEQERETLAKQIAALEQSLNAQAQSHIEGIHAERRALEDRFNSEIAELNNRIRSVEAERDELALKSKTLDQDLSALQQQLDSEVAGAEGIRSVMEMERNELSSRVSVLEQELKAQSAAFDARMADVESTHRSSIEGMESSFRDERQRATEAHNAALADIERRHGDELASTKRELEQMRFTTETLQSELAVARKMHVEVVSGLDRERAQFVSDKEAIEDKLRDIESSRAEVLNCMGDRENAIAALTARIQSAEAEIDNQRNELAALREEGTQLKGRAGSLSSELADARNQLERAEARSNETAAALDKLASELEHERARREEAQRDSAQEITRLEHELARTRDQRDILHREKDDLTRRIAQLTDQQKRMLDDFAAGIGNDSQPVRAALHTTERTASVILPSNPIIIDVTPEDGNISLPRIRPVPVRPPQVNVQ